MTRRTTKVEAATSLQRVCPKCSAKPDALCTTPTGKPFKRAGKTVHYRRTLVLAPLSHLAVTSSGHGHVRSAQRGAHGLCGTAVTLEWVSTVRVSCAACYSAKAHLLAHPGTTTTGGATMLPLDGGIPEDSTL